MLDRKHFKCVQTLMHMHPLPWTADDWKSRLHDFHSPGPNWVRDNVVKANNDINMSRCHFPSHLNWIIMKLQDDNRPPCDMICILPTPTCIWVRERAVIGNFVVKTQHCHLSYVEFPYLPLLALYLTAAKWNPVVDSLVITCLLAFLLRPRLGFAKGTQK